MPNVRTISQEDLDKYPSLRGKKVGDTITAQEDAKLQEDEDKKNDEDNEAAEKVTVRTLSRTKKK